MAPDEQSLVQRRPFGGYGVWTGLGKPAAGRSRRTSAAFPCLSYTRCSASSPKITLIGSLDTAVPEQLSDDALATLRESLSNVVPNAEADAGDVLVGVDTTAKTLTIQVEDNGVGIDPQVTPGGRNTAARARASGEHTTVVRRSEPGTTFTWVGLPLEGKWELITDAAGGNPAVCAHFQRGRRPRGVRTWSGPGGSLAPDPPESASATVGAATWPRRLIMRMLRTNRTAVGSGVRGGRS